MSPTSGPRDQDYPLWRRVLLTPVGQLVRGHIGPGTIVKRVPAYAAPPLWRRVFRTPMWRLVTGRIASGETVRSVLSKAALPPALADTVRTVARRARLWADERADVAHELSSHFLDGLAGGASPEQLRADFGDLKPAARLIHRAKVRNRPLAWKLMRLTRRTLVAMLVFVALVYAVQAARMRWGHPLLTRNYLAEWNAATLAVPERDRAWPVYRAGARACSPTLDFPGDYAELTPDDPNWAKIAAQVEQNAQALALFHEAARKPALGALFEALENESEALYGPPRGSHSRYSVPAAGRNPDLLAASLPDVAALRTAARLLVLDAYVALADGASERACDDLRDALRVVAHTREVNYLICDLVATAEVRLVAEVLASMLAARPDAFTDAQWTALAHELAAAGGDLRPRFDSDRAIFADIFQRYYNADGSPRPELLLRTWQSREPREPQAPRYVFNLTLPLLSAVTLSRDELARKADDIYTHVAAEAERPFWLRNTHVMADEVQAMNATRYAQSRYWPLSALMPTMTVDRAVTLGDFANQERNGVLVAIALELYHRRHEAWPARLVELTPEFLPTVPLDCWDGQPLRYRVVDGRPLIYSVGADRQDDGGRLPDIPVAQRPKPLMPNLAGYLNRRAREPDAPNMPGYVNGDWILWPRPVTRATTTAPAN
jgi:hypothetical protein